MTDDLAVEAAPGTSRPAYRDRGGLSGLAAWLLVALAAVGMLASTPPSAGPDEPVHEITAGYLTGSGPQPDSAGSFSVPASLWLNLLEGHPCFAGQPAVNAAC